MKDLNDQIKSIDKERITIEKSIKSLKESTLVFGFSSRESQIKPLMVKQAQLETKKQPLKLDYTELEATNNGLLKNIDTYRKPLEDLLEIYVKKFPNNKHRPKYAELLVYFRNTVPDYKSLAAIADAYERRNY